MARKPHRHYHSLRKSIRQFGLTMSSIASSNKNKNKKKRQAQITKLKEIPDYSRGFEVKSELSGNGDIINASQDDDSDSSELQKDVVELEVVYVPPEPNDFHGVKALLQTYLDDKEWDLSGFVDLIIGQTTVGKVVIIEDDEDENVYSVVSALNLDRYKDQRCIMELKDFLLESCLDKNVNVLSDLTTMLLGDQAQGVGLLVSWHVVNLPPQILPRLYDCLFDAILQATKEEPTKELQKSFRFKHYLIVTQIYVLQQKHSNNKSGSSKSENEDVIYIKPEDEIFFELSSWSFNFPLRRQRVTPKELKNFKRMGLVMAVEASKISAFRKELKSFSIVDESYHD